MSKVVLQSIKNRNGTTAGVHQLKERHDTTDASSADSAIDYNGTGLVLTATHILYGQFVTLDFSKLFQTQVELFIMFYF